MRKREREREIKKKAQKQQRSETLTCGDTAGNADATDPSDTRRHHRDADYSKRKEGSSSWTWGRYFLQ